MKKMVIVIVFSFFLLISLYTIQSTRAACANKMPGDSNCDGKVDLTDFEIFRQEYLLTVSTKNADFNTDGVVNLVDFNIWREAYFQSQTVPTPTVTSSQVSLTPTPTSTPITFTHIYFISPNGSDSNPGTAAAPFKTIGRGIAIAQPGDAVRIKSGTYSGGIKITGKNGTPEKPIYIFGDSENQQEYPVVQGAGPLFTLENSSWISFERLRLLNTSDAGFLARNSKYLTFRRNIIKFKRYGVKNDTESHHLLLEYNEMYQFDSPGIGAKRINSSLPSWITLKGSEYEGGAYTSHGGAGMIVIRNNYFHDSFNAVYMGISGRPNDFHDANVWVYKNRFERIVDDPFEPETYAFNNHFFNNTLIDTHRMVSLEVSIQGPIYVYDNIQLISYDITKESRINSAIKMVNLNGTKEPVYFFNNSIDASATGVNGYGVDILNSSVVNFQHFNNAYKVEMNTFKGTMALRGNSLLDNDISNKNLGEAQGFENTDPGFTNPLQENFSPTAQAALKGKAKTVTFTNGFSNPFIIQAGDDLGAYQSNTGTFRSSPAPKYEVPPGGEYVGFGSGNLPWPSDMIGGQNPIAEPK